MRSHRRSRLLALDRFGVRGMPWATITALVRGVWLRCVLLA
jgi:hypothetical protein